MPAASARITIFHRRLAALLILWILVMLVLLGQLSRLTLAQGSEHRRDAEAKLVTREWLPTGRGKILDRKGRVLAQDRPSFSVAVDYRVISGQWAIRRAGAAAKKHHRARWPAMGPQERQELIDQYIVIYQDHVDSMWRRFASVAGLDEAEVERRREQVLTRVQSRQRSVQGSNFHRDQIARLAKGEEISAQIEDETRRRIERPIEEEQQPHVLIAAADDDAAFEFMRLSQQTAEVGLPAPGGVTAAETLPLMPGLSVTPSGEREYPLDTVRVEIDTSPFPPPVRALLGEPAARAVEVSGVLYHVVGRMKERAQLEDTQRRERRMKDDPAFASRVREPSAGVDRGQYFDDDASGLSGIEFSREDDLRGLRGLKVHQLETGAVVQTDPARGRDVRLTVDAALQARIQALMSPDLGLAVAQEWHGRENPTVPVGTPLNGAAVVLEVDSGDILAMVSTPSIPRGVLRDEPARIFEDPLNKLVDMPWIDRSIGRPYPPGSIAKAMVLCGAATFGRHSLDSHVDCTGHLFPDRPDMFRCWAFKQFHRTHTDQLGHALSGPEALMVSCNIYFFTLGQRLGAQGMTDTYAMFGLGQPWNLGVGIEFPGEIGEPMPGGRRKALTIQDAIQMGIGQGPVSWTPLHAADAYATLARAGTRIRPRVVDEAGSMETMDLGLDRRAVRESLQGLLKSVNETLGTGHHLTIDGRYVPHFNAPNVVVWGKTGTATAPSIRVRQDHPLWDRALDAGQMSAALNEPEFRLAPGERLLRWGDHSWFVVLVGTKAENRPLYSIAVMMEYAGSGGKVSGPIVNQIIHALIAEGYLS